ncbi:MAG TPA: hypothetical protein PKA60_02635 [Candidatus Paceibacterota bacterium]|nr:hypothetical protein [Candidatus Paceibacterota bacterium]
MKVRNFLLALLALFFVPVISFAQENKLQLVSCFDPGLYEFQSVEVAVGPVDNRIDSVINPGDTIDFEGGINNKNPYPIVDGYVFARVSQMNENSFSEGYDIIDEFFVAEKIAIDGSSEKELNFSWNVPNSIGSGQYRVDYYFVVGNKFNLAGLPFTNEINAGFTLFDIESSQNRNFILDRTNTKFNSEKYEHIGNWPFFSDETGATITQPIKNLTSSPINVDVSYDLFYWDSVNELNLIDSKKETVTVSSNSSFDLEYNLGSAEEIVYYLRITAEKDGQKSIVNIRFINESADSEGARINYPAITKFPISKSENLRAFVCFHGVSDNSSEQKIVSLKLTDKSGNIIASDSYQTEVTSQMQALAMDIISGKDYKYLKLNAEITDLSGKVLDFYEAEYDCNTLQSKSCYDEKKGLYDKNLILYSLFALLSLLVLILCMNRVQNPSTRKLLIALLTIAFVAFVILALSTVVDRAKTTFAQPNIQGTWRSYSGKGTTTDGRQNFSFGFDDRTIANGVTVTRTTIGILKGSGTTINVGDTIRVVTGTVCDYNLSGGAWGTPRCGQTMEFKETLGYRNAKATFTVPNAFGAADITANNAVLSCVSKANYTTSDGAIYREWDCTAIAPGNSNITVVYPEKTSQLKACAQRDNNIQAVSETNLAGNDPGCPGVVGGGRIGTNRTGTQNLFNNDTAIKLPSHTLSWSIVVNEQQQDTDSDDNDNDNGGNGGDGVGGDGVTPESGTCGAQNGGTSENAPSGSGLCSSGTPSVVDGSGSQWVWTCGSGTGQALCSANKPGNEDDANPISISDEDIDNENNLTDVLNLAAIADPDKFCSISFKVKSPETAGTCTIQLLSGAPVSDSISFNASLEGFTPPARSLVSPGTSYKVVCTNSVIYGGEEGEIIADSQTATSKTLRCVTNPNYQQQ